MQPRHEKQDHVLGRRIFTLILMDLLAINISALAALLVRFEFDISALAESGFVQVYLETAPVYSLGSIGLFALFHLYRSLWRYARGCATSSSRRSPHRCSSFCSAAC